MYVYIYMYNTQFCKVVVKFRGKESYVQSVFSLILPTQVKRST